MQLRDRYRFYLISFRQTLSNTGSFYLVRECLIRPSYSNRLRMSGKTVFKLLEKHAIVIHSKDSSKWWDLPSFCAHRGVSMGDKQPLKV